MKKTRVAKVDEIRLGRTKVCEVDGKMILVVHTGTDQWFAVAELCPHRGGPLSEGELSGTTITCPWHRAQFDVTSGNALSGPTTEKLEEFGVEVINGEVFVSLQS